LQAVGTKLAKGRKCRSEAPITKNGGASDKKKKGQEREKEEEINREI